MIRSAPGFQLVTHPAGSSTTIAQSITLWPSRGKERRSRPAESVQEATAHRLGDSCRPIRDGELLVDVVKMGLHGCLADDELLRYASRSHSGSRELQHLHLAWAQQRLPALAHLANLP